MSAPTVTADTNDLRSRAGDRRLRNEPLQPDCNMAAPARRVTLQHYFRRSKSGSRWSSMPRSEKIWV